LSIPVCEALGQWSAECARWYCDAVIVFEPYISRRIWAYRNAEGCRGRDRRCDVHVENLRAERSLCRPCPGDSQIDGVVNRAQVDKHLVSNGIASVSSTWAIRIHANLG